MYSRSIIYTLLISLLFIFSSPIQAGVTAEGSGWTNRSGATSSTLYEVISYGSIGQHRLAVGAGGTVIRSSDGGETWADYGSSATSQTLYAVDHYSPLFSSSKLWAVGHGVKMSKVGNANWDAYHDRDPKGYYYGIDFASEFTGFIAGKRQIDSVNKGVVLKTTTGGNTWTTQAAGEAGLPASVFSFDDIICISTSICWAVGQTVGGSVLVKTINGGTGWTWQPLTLGVRAVHFTSSTIGWIVGDNGYIRKTITGGNNWIDQSIRGVTDDLKDVYFRDSSNGLIVGENGTILRTTNGGDTWIPEDSGTTVTLGGVLARSVATSGLTDVAVGASGKILVQDTELPTGTISINSGAEYTSLVNVTAALSCTDNLTCERMQVAGDGTADTEIWHLFGSSYNLDLPAGDGTKTVAVRFRDSGSNVSTQVADTIILDTDPPSTPSSLVRTSLFSDTTPDFIWEASADVNVISHYEMDIDGEGYNNIGLNISYTYPTPLSAGVHGVKVRAVDKAGNEGVAASLDFAITATDTTPPSIPTHLTRITAVSDPTPTFTWAASTDPSGITRYEFEIDERGHVSTGLVLTYTSTTALSVGSHTAKVRAVDGIGNRSDYTTLTFTVYPDTSISSCNGGVPSDNAATMEFDIASGFPAGDYTFECKLGSAPYTGCVSPKIYPDLEAGMHTFQVRAIGSTIVDPTPSSCAVTIAGGGEEDGLGVIDTVIISAPDPTTTSTSATFTFGVPAGTPLNGYTYECSLGGADFVACGSPITYSDLTIDEHVFRARTLDGELVDPTPASYEWEVIAEEDGGLAFDTVIDSGPDLTTTSNSATFIFGVSPGTPLNGYTSECALNSTPFSACTSPHSYAGLGVGEYVFQARMLSHGVPDPTPASYIWTITSSGSGTGTPGGSTPSTPGDTGTRTGSGTTSDTTPKPPFTLDQMLIDAQLIQGGDRAALFASLEYASIAECELTEDDAAQRVDGVFASELYTGGSMIGSADLRAKIINFTACGTVSTLHLGAGERLGVVNSYWYAFAPFVPTMYIEGQTTPTLSTILNSTDHWFDIMKIANGRFPGQTSWHAEPDAKQRFQRIYLRDPNMNHENDKAAVTVMAYGLRPLPRNLNSERSAIKIFKGIFDYNPTSATDWDAVRAIAYSGAVR